MSKELKGKSKMVDLTGEDDEGKENKEVDVLGLSFCLGPVKWPVSDAALGFFWSAGPPEMPEGYKEALQEAMDTTKWGEKKTQANPPGESSINC